jgi:hypothetical protein
MLPATARRDFLALFASFRARLDSDGLPDPPGPGEAGPPGPGPNDATAASGGGGAGPGCVAAAAAAAAPAAGGTGEEEGGRLAEGLSRRVFYVRSTFRPANERLGCGLDMVGGAMAARGGGSRALEGMGGASARRIRRARTRWIRAGPDPPGSGRT